MGLLDFAWAGNVETTLVASGAFEDVKGRGGFLSSFRKSLRGFIRWSSVRFCVLDSVVAIGTAEVLTVG